MLIQVLVLLVGLALLIQGGGFFVAASVRVAEMLRLPRVVIGSTLVSLATTSPELVVSITAGLKGESGLAVGNAVGSCICNIALIVGVMAVIKHIDVHLPSLRVPFGAMAGFGFMLLLLTLDLGVSRSQGALLLVLGSLYFTLDFVRQKRDTQPADVAEAEAIEQEWTAGQRWLRTGWGTAAVFLLGGVMVVGGSKLLVESAVFIATALGVPSIVIGLTVVAVGTSLPELITAITSSRQNVSDLAIGNILGANVANLTLILGSAAAIQEVTMSRATQLFNFPALLLLMGVLFWVLRTGSRVSRREGFALLLYYACYLAGLIALTMLGRT
jgi:cation:H+ antiporter